MPEYTVDFPLIHKKKKYMPGETVNMDEKLAGPLIAKGALLDSGQDSPVDVTENAVVAAIHKMEPMDGTQWTADGKPQIPALEALLDGKKVTAAQRDAVWERYQKKKTV